jgi:TonB family protein
MNTLNSVSKKSGAKQCRSKGRFQDRDYCSSAVIDQIVADGKSAIPILISQITDPRWIDEPVYDYWPRIRTGELTYFILGDLFLDDTWQKSTMPALFPAQNCNEAAWVCWEQFRKTHSLKELQARWIEFWKANQSRIYWDGKARCFRLSDVAQAEAPQPRRIRVNEDVQKAKLVHMVFPVYPPVTRGRLDGTVVLHVVVGKDGAVKSARYVSGPTRLANSAVNAVLQWRYKPTLMNGVPAEVDTTVSVVFPPLSKGRGAANE